MNNPESNFSYLSSERFISRALGFIPQEQDSPFELPSEAQQNAERFAAHWNELDPVDRMKLSLAVAAAEQKEKA